MALGFCARVALAKNVLLQNSLLKQNATCMSFNLSGIAQGSQMRDKQIMSTEKVACNSKEERDWNDLLIRIRQPAFNGAAS